MNFNAIDEISDCRNLVEWSKPDSRKSDIIKSKHLPDIKGSVCHLIGLIFETDRNLITQDRREALRHLAQGISRRVWSDYLIWIGRHAYESASLTRCAWLEPLLVNATLVAPRSEAR